MSQPSVRDKAIAVLEGIALLWENGRKNPERADALMGAVYRYSHLARGTCENPHADWLVEMNQTYEAFIKGGLISRCQNEGTETENT